MREQVETSVNLGSIVLLHAATFVFLAVATWTTVQILERLYEGHPPRQIHVVEEYSLWFLSVGFLVQLLIDLTKHFIRQVPRGSSR